MQGNAEQKLRQNISSSNSSKLLQMIIVWPQKHESTHISFRIFTYGTIRITRKRNNSFFTLVGFVFIDTLKTNFTHQIFYDFFALRIIWIEHFSDTLIITSTYTFSAPKNRSIDVISFVTNFLLQFLCIQKHQN